MLDLHSLTPDPLLGTGVAKTRDSLAHNSTCSCHTCISRSVLSSGRNSVPSSSDVLADELWDQPGGKGKPLTLTYSYTSGFLDSIIGLSKGQVKASIERAFSIFAQYVPITFVELRDKGPSTQAVRDDFIPAQADEPQLRFHYADLDANSSRDMLGEAYFPDNFWGFGGDIFFDNDVWDVGLFVEVALHEIGHALGMEHVSGVDSIMHAFNTQNFNSLASARLLPFDIQTIQYAYGEGSGSVIGRRGGTSNPPSTPLEDVDNLYLQRAAGLIGQWQMAEDGRVKGWSKIRNANGATLVASGDFNGDGNDDLVVQRGTRGVTIWNLTENGEFDGSTWVGNGKGLNVVAAGDINGDGQDDLILQKGTGTVGVWTMGNNGKVRGWTAVRHAKGLNVVASGDFNGNGRDDLVLQRGTENAGIWNMNKNGTVKSWTPIRSNSNGYQIVGAGNFAGSDQDDLVLQRGTGKGAIWTMENAAVQDWTNLSSNPKGFSLLA